MVDHFVLSVNCCCSLKSASDALAWFIEQAQRRLNPPPISSLCHCAAIIPPRHLFERPLNFLCIRCCGGKLIAGDAAALLRQVRSRRTSSSSSRAAAEQQLLLSAAAVACGAGCPPPSPPHGLAAHSDRDTRAPHARGRAVGGGEGGGGGCGAGTTPQAG